MTIHSQDQMSLSITRTPDSTVDYVQIRGDVDLSDSCALGLAARQLIEADANVIYVDLGGTTFMGSTLVAFLVHVGHANGRAGRPLVLCRPRPMARKVIHLTGLEELASVRPDLPPLWPGAAPVEPDSLPMPEPRRCDPVEVGPAVAAVVGRSRPAQEPAHSPDRKGTP